MSQILALAHEQGVPVVPQGGNTGLVGGQIPTRGEILLSLGRLKRVRAVDAAGLHHDGGGRADARRGAGRGRGRSTDCSRSACRPRAAARSAATSPSMPAGRACCAYGNARQLVLGLEVVLADGRVWDGSRACKKDNTGYDLKQTSSSALRARSASSRRRCSSCFPKPAREGDRVRGAARAWTPRCRSSAWRRRRLATV